MYANFACHKSWMPLSPGSGAFITCTHKRLQIGRQAAIPADEGLVWWGQWDMLTVICHSAEIQSSQVERDNIVERFFFSSITTFHSSKSNSAHRHTHKMWHLLILQSHARCVCIWYLLRVVTQYIVTSKLILIHNSKMHVSFYVICIHNVT